VTDATTIEDELRQTLVTSRARTKFPAHGPLRFVALLENVWASIGRRDPLAPPPRLTRSLTTPGLHQRATEAGGFAFRNGGTGIARNGRGRIQWPVEGGEAALIGQTLGAADHARLRVGEEKRIENWSGAEGYVVYDDTQGDEWQSRFRYEQAGGQVWAELIELGLTRGLGDWKPTTGS
jgi:hypothetical protein